MVNRFRKIRSGLIALAAALFAPATAQVARPDLDPAVWVVKDSDTTIYLFGTIHALDGKADWLNDEVKGAFDKSNELVLEIISPDDPSAMLPLLQQYAIDKSGKTLPDRLSPKGREFYLKRLKELGMPANAFDSYKPFFAAMTLSVLDMQALGMDPGSGAEKVLTAAAKQQGKRIGEVESVEQQFQMLASLPEDEQVKMLESTLEDSTRARDTLSRLVDAWGKGQPDKVADIMNESEEESRVLYQRLLVDRNRTWAGWIQQRLGQPGTVFMAVGAGHLAGPDSVQRFLKERGIVATRVPHVGN